MRGLNELVRDFGRLDAELKRGLQREIHEAAAIVSNDARGRAGRFGAPVALKIRPRVRGARGFVESRARSRGVRPDFGALLMRTALLPALGGRQEDVVRRLEGMLDRLAHGAGF